MQTLRFTIKPLTAFGTPLVGDTLFGQLCWILRHHFGNEWLTERLAGYTQSNPFLVLSDAFPSGFLPLPAMPVACWAADESADRKALKKRRWLPLKEISTSFRDWQKLAKNDREVAKAVLRDSVSSTLSLSRNGGGYQILSPQPHNSINRTTGSTGEDMFAPYSLTQVWFHSAMRFNLYAVIDEKRLSAESLHTALTDMGQSGYGANASIGLGKFEIERDAGFAGLPHAKNANAFLTLAPCAPQNLGFAAAKSFYQPLTRFGRHGDAAALSGNPFKRPLLMAKTGAVFTPESGQCTAFTFIGQGLGDVSPSQPETVAQGYAPIIGIRMEIEP